MVLSLKNLLITKQKTLLSKDNKVFLASQERFELPIRQLPMIYKRFFHRLLNVHLYGQLTVFFINIIRYIVVLRQC